MKHLSIVVPLLLASHIAAQQVSITPYHESGIYRVGEKAGWKVALPQGSYDYEIRTNNRDVVQKGALDLSSGSAVIETTLREPCMLYVEIRNITATPPAKPIHLGAAIAPKELTPAVPRPVDFDAFWDGKLKALADVPIHPILTPAPTTKDGVDFYTAKLDSLGSNVQGYLAKPAREGKFPALVIFQYAGVYALRPDTVTNRAAEGWLAFDVDSHDIPPSQPDGVSTRYAAIGNTDRETSYFLNMYLRDSRAIDYIASRPDWDGKTLVIMGTSMGGQQSLVTAGLNQKVTGVLVNEPSGADSNGDLHGRKAGYPNWPSDNPDVMKTALYFDVVNFTSRIRAPVLAAIGFIDTTAPPAGIWTAIDQVPGPKEVISMVESDHNNRTPEKQGAWTARSAEVLDTLLHGGEFKPRAPDVQ